MELCNPSRLICIPLLRKVQPAQNFLYRLRAKACIQLQKALEARFPAKAARNRHLTERKAQWIERVANEKTLFALLWDQGKFQAMLPPAAGESNVVRSESRTDDLVEVIVQTDSGERRFLFHRVLGGEWRFAHLRATIEREALRFMEAELRAVPPK